jgi:3-phenylpropionate/cinnamic acid dioxygenase small subunit
VDDIEAIRQLTARYNRASDEGDTETWLDCFSVDGVFRRSNDTREFRGHEELGQLRGRIPVRSRHITTDFEISVQGDTAEQICYLMFLDRDRDFMVYMFGTYHDKLKRVDDRWKFSNRLLVIDEP